MYIFVSLFYVVVCDIFLIYIIFVTNVWWYLCSYTWKIYAEKLINLTNIFGFWKYLSKNNKREIQRYMKMFYILKYQQLVSK
jgi:hypothetical protein